MRVTQPLLAKSFLARSMDELKRRSSIAWNLEAVKGPSGPRTLYDFHDASSVKDCINMSDDLIGGSSKTNLDHISPAAAPTTASSSSTTQSPSSYMRFHGSISTALPSDRPKIQRTGYAAFRTPDQPPTVFGNAVWDIDPYTYLALRVKSDGRSYFVNLQTDGIEPTDLHQHRLFAKRPGQWETVLIKWNDFVRTNFGFVVEPQTELLRQRVRTAGVGLTDRVEGPFELCIERIWATNQEPEMETKPEEKKPAVEEPDAGKTRESPLGDLKNKKGEKIQW